MYFSVKVGLTIAGKQYKPCICYALPEYLVITVEELAKNGKAEIYKEKRFFCNGKLVDLPKPKKEKKIKKEIVETPKEEIKEEDF